MTRRRWAAICAVLALLVALCAALAFTQGGSDTYKGLPRFNAKAHGCSPRKAENKPGFWTCVSNERNYGTKAPITGRTVRLASTASPVIPAPDYPSDSSTVDPPATADTDDTDAPVTIPTDGSDTPSNLGDQSSTANAELPPGSLDGTITPATCAPGGALYVKPKAALTLPAGGGYTPPGCPNNLPGDGSGPAVQYHCKPHGGCWYRPRSNFAYFDSNTGYYGIYSPNGSFYTVGREYHYVAWTINGAYNHTMHMDGWINFLYANAGNDTVDFSGALFNGGPGHATFGSVIGSPCTPHEVRFTANPGQTGRSVKAYAPGSPFCTRSDSHSHDHTMALQFLWLPDDSNVPWNTNFHCYVGSPIAYSSDGGLHHAYYFHSLHSKYYGMVAAAAATGCGSAGGEVELG